MTIPTNANSPTSSSARPGYASSSGSIDLATLNPSEAKVAIPASKRVVVAQSRQTTAKPVGRPPNFAYPNPADVRANEVKVGGVSITKYPQQSELSTVRTGTAYPAAALRNLNPTVYVIDSFDTPSVKVGSGAQRVAISHGDHCASIIKAGLPTVKVVQIEATTKGVVSQNAMGAGIDQVIAREAKLQGTSKPDLSRVFISMSLGESKRTVLPYQMLSEPIARFTQLGGTIYGSAGNEILNTTGSNPGVGVVYATQAVIGSTLSRNPLPAQSLPSGIAQLGGSSTSKLPFNRVDASSHSYVGAGTAPQRYNPVTKGVENLNAQGQWVPAVAAGRVSASPAPGVAAIGSLNNVKSSRELGVKDVDQFDAWRAAQEKAAIANHKMSAGIKRAASYDDLSTAEVNLLGVRAKAEFRARFGDSSVMSAATFKTLAQIPFGSDAAVLYDRALPAKLTAATSFVSAEDAIFGTDKPGSGVQHYYSQARSGVLKQEPRHESSTISTSSATPDLVVRAVQDRAVRLSTAQSARSSVGP